MTVDCIVFDFDGTLVDSNLVKRSSFYRVVADVPGAAAALDEIFTEPEPGDRYAIFRRLNEMVAMNDSASSPGIFAERYGALCQERILDLLAESDVESTLEALRAGGYALFVNTATPQEAIAAILKRVPYGRLFAGIYGAPTSKAENLTQIMTVCERTKDDVVVVGDSEDDRRLAEMAGCRFVGVDRGEGRFVEAPAVWVTDLGDLPDVLARMR